MVNRYGIEGELIYQKDDGHIVRYEDYGILQQKFGGVSSLCEEAMRINCEWEKSMMAAIGEDGIVSVTKAIDQLKADKHALQQNLDAMVDKLARSEDYSVGVDAERMEYIKKCNAMASENAALKSERAQMVEIGELIRTQDNRITDQPLFAVMTKREMVGSEDHDYDRICWVENQSGNYVESTETQHRRLEAIYQGKYEVREGWDRYAMKEIDVFVTGCFTEQGCKDYISRNAHNLNKPFIYAFGSYRNNEYQAVRKFIMDLPETPATDAYLNSVRAEGVSISVAELKTLAQRSMEEAPNASEHIHASALFLMTIAESLRSGTHDTADKAG